jgi:hypothetical protein
MAQAVVGGGWRRVPDGTAAAVCRRYAPAAEAAAVLAPAADPPQFLDALAGRELFPEAVRFLAHALPVREALWWGCLSVRAAGAAADPPAAAAVEATETYVRTPTDAHRRAAFAAGEAAGLGTAAGALAAAAFFSGGSLGPPNVPPVPPPDHLAPMAVTNALVLAAVVPDPPTAADRYRRFLDLGRQVAAGAERWPS